MPEIVEITHHEHYTQIGTPKLSPPRYEKQHNNSRVRVRDVEGLIFRVKLDRSLRARLTYDDRSPDKPMNFGVELYGVDAGIADVLRILNMHGYPTMASMSGLIKDYPNSKEGAGFGYILFFKMDPHRERVITKEARTCGLTYDNEYENRRLRGARGIRIGTEVLKDGRSRIEFENEIRKETALEVGLKAERRKNFVIPSWSINKSIGEVRFRELFDKWSELFSRRIEKAEKSAYISQREVIQLWKCFTKKLTGEEAKVF